MGSLGGPGSFLGRGDELGALGDCGLCTSEIIRGTLKRGFMGVQLGLRGRGFLGPRLLVSEIGLRSGKFGLGGGLVALELFVALDHGVELAQYAGSLCVFFFGAGQGFGGFLVPACRITLRRGEIALILLVHAGQQRGVIAGDFFLG